MNSENILNEVCLSFGIPHRQSLKGIFSTPGVELMVGRTTMIDYYDTCEALSSAGVDVPAIFSMLLGSYSTELYALGHAWH